VLVLPLVVLYNRRLPLSYPHDGQPVVLLVVLLLSSLLISFLLLLFLLVLRLSLVYLPILLPIDGLRLGLELCILRVETLFRLVLKSPVRSRFYTLVGSNRGPNRSYNIQDSNEPQTEPLRTGSERSVCGPRPVMTGPTT
jgi:hypothetical protein